MSHYSEHQKMEPVLALARKLDIATNPHPAAIFEAGSGGFQVWCTPIDYHQGWNDIVMQAGSFSKPCEYVGSVNWKWEGDRIVGLEIETSAYALADQKPEEFCNLTDIPHGFKRRTIFNRDADIEWLKEKIAWLFAEAGAPLLPFEYKQAALSEMGPYLLAHYTSETEEYVVIVSPQLDPEKFCRPGYALAHTLAIWKAGDFPADVILRPEYGLQEAEVEPEENPLVGRHENAFRPSEESWLEAAYDDSVSGWNE